MKTNKGFSLAEMVAVIGILMLMAFLSVPYVKGYIDDSYNGKALVYMQQLNEARLNFEKDYPGTTVGGTMDADFTSTGQCNIDSIYESAGALDISVLTACKYLTVPTDLLQRYIFKIGGSACSACNSVVEVIMLQGTDNAGVYKNKCACIDSLGIIHKQP